MGWKAKQRVWVWVAQAHKGSRMEGLVYRGHHETFTPEDKGPHRADTLKTVTCKPNYFDLTLMLWRENAPLFTLFPLPLGESARQPAHHRASHWSGWIAGDSSSQPWPSEEDPLTHPGSPSNRIDNSSAAAPTSPRANKIYNSNVGAKVWKRNVGNTLICFYKKFDSGRIHRSPRWWLPLKRNLKYFFPGCYFLPACWFLFVLVPARSGLFLTAIGWWKLDITIKLNIYTAKSHS